VVRVVDCSDSAVEGFVVGCGVGLVGIVATKRIGDARGLAFMGRIQKIVQLLCGLRAQVLWSSRMICARMDARQIKKSDEKL